MDILSEVILRADVINIDRARMAFDGAWEAKHNPKREAHRQLNEVLFDEADKRLERLRIAAGLKRS